MISHMTPALLQEADLRVIYLSCENLFHNQAKTKMFKGLIRIKKHYIPISGGEAALLVCLFVLIHINSIFYGQIENFKPLKVEEDPRCQFEIFIHV